MKFNPETSQSCLQFFVKTLDCSSVPSILTPKIDISNKEVCFYQYMDYISAKESKASTQNVIPHIYFSDKTTNTIVLEDLSKIGYKKCVAQQFDDDHIRVVLTSLAKFHSLSIIHDQRFKSKRSMESEIFKVAIEESLFGNINDDLLKLLTNNLVQEGENHQVNLFEEYKKMIQGFVTIVPDGCNVCCHGDLFFDNILFKYEDNNLPTHCEFIDFGFARFKPPAHDVTMFLFTCVSSKLRQAKLNYFLKYYYTQLRNVLKQDDLDMGEILPLHEYELSCKKYMRYARMIVALYKVIHNSCEEDYDRCKSYTRKYAIQSDLSTAISNTILSIEDIHTIVQKKIKTTEYELQDYTLHPVAVKTGFLGEHMNLTVEIILATGDRQLLKYFVKSLPKLEAQRNFVIESGGIFKETSWFRKLLPDYLENGIIDIVQKCIPGCYMARDNDVFVFDDLKEVGYETFSVRSPLDLNGMKHALSSLANFHAAPLILEELKSQQLGREYRLTEDYAKEFQETFYSTGQKCIDLKNAMIRSTSTYVDLLPVRKECSVTRDDIINMHRKFVGEYYNDVQPSTNFRNTICHGDLWTANIMFKKENNIVNNAMIVDFQSYRYAPPAQDLLAVIYMTTNRAVRKQYIHFLTSYYYEELGKILADYNLSIADIISLEEFQHSVEHYEKFAVTQASTHMQIVTMSEETMKRFFDDKEWCRECLFVDRTETIIKCCNEDSVYRKIQEETLTDFTELCEKLKPKML